MFAADQPVQKSVSKKDARMDRLTPAGDADYSRIGLAYERYRRPDERIAARIAQALGEAQTVLNVGAGAGGYEPTDREITAVEPSATMRARRPLARGPSIDAIAEALPFADDSFEGSMAVFTVHQWRDLARGLAELRRVTRGPIAILTCDPDEVERFWLANYCPEVLAVEARRYPSIDQIAAGLGPVRAEPVAIPAGCTDGFQEAYFGKPEMFLDGEARDACSAWSFVARSALQRFEFRLRDDLRTGRWDEEFGGLRTACEYLGSLRLIVSS